MSEYRCHLTRDWSDIQNIYLYGYGDVALGCIEKFAEDFHVLAIADQDRMKQGIKTNNIEVISPEKLFKERIDEKIIVMTGGRAYQEIARDLQMKKLIEYRDFCSAERFITEWYWKYKEKNCQMEIHMAVTLRCTLRCKNCNMFIPYQQKAQDFSFERMQADMDSFFRYVDYVFRFVLLGGEPFLNPVLSEILQYLREKYRKNVGKIVIISNGTLVPEKKVFEQLQLCNAEVKISDYTKQVPYQERMMEFIGKLEQYHIRYTVNKAMLWKDFGFPETPCHYEENEVRVHMLQCGPIFHGLNDQKFYFCHVAWGAEKCGKIQLKASDYIDLADEEPRETVSRKIAAQSLAELDTLAISLCSMCGGCGTDNKAVVAAGRQC